MLLSIRINTWSINKWAFTRRSLVLFDMCLCIHVPLDALSGLFFFCIHPKHTHTHTCATSALRAQTQTGVFLYKESKPGASHFEIKSMSLCSTSAPGMRGRTPKCRSEEREEHCTSAVMFTARESRGAFYLFPSIRRHPAGKVGGLD